MAEPGGVGGVSSVERGGPALADVAGGAVVDRRRDLQPDVGVAVHVVVLVEKRSAERSGVLDGAETGQGRRGST